MRYVMEGRRRRTGVRAWIRETCEGCERRGQRASMIRMGR